MGGKMLLDAYGTNWAKIDPLSPEALLLVLAGPYVGFHRLQDEFRLQVAAVARHRRRRRAAATSFTSCASAATTGSSSRGRPARPTYLTIFDDKVEFRDASKMWGKEIPETHQMIVDEHGNQTSQYYIGPAGENLVRYRGGHHRMVPGGGARRRAAR